MSKTPTIPRGMKVAGAVLILGASLALPADAQTAPAPAPTAPAAPAPSPARQAIEARKAVFTLIGNNFRPLGEVAKGTTPYDGAEIQKRIARVVFLTELLPEAFPDISNTGQPDTRAKPEAWTNREDFNKKIKDFQAHAAALVQVNATENNATDAFKSAVLAVGQDCKGCHDTYRVK
jgi:cytochrome c556